MFSQTLWCQRLFLLCSLHLMDTPPLALLGITYVMSTIFTLQGVKCTHVTNAALGNINPKIIFLGLGARNVQKTHFVKIVDANLVKSVP